MSKPLHESIAIVQDFISSDISKGTMSNYEHCVTVQAALAEYMRPYVEVLGFEGVTVQQSTMPGRWEIHINSALALEKHLEITQHFINEGFVSSTMTLASVLEGINDLDAWYEKPGFLVFYVPGVGLAQTHKDKWDNYYAEDFPGYYNYKIAFEPLDN